MEKIRKQIYSVKDFEIAGSIRRTPYVGIGKPEALKHELAGYWSRRINNEHRIVYTVSANRIKVISMRFHYR